MLQRVPATAFAEWMVWQKYGAKHVTDLDWEPCMIHDGDSCWCRIR